jgi:hypothetical protein
VWRACFGTFCVFWGGGIGKSFFFFFLFEKIEKKVGKKKGWRKNWRKSVKSGEN